MKYEILDAPDFGFVRVTFDQAGEKMLSESGAMVARDTAVEMETQMRGGLMAAAKRKLLGGESIFQNTFTATSPGQRLFLAPAPEGDLQVKELDGTEPLMLASGCYVASGPDITLDTKWGGAKGFFSSAGLFLLRIEGTGPVFYSTYGAMHAVEVGPEGYIVDNNHIVGFTGGLDYNVKKVGGLKSLLLSGEGLVAEFRGSGTVWLSTRSASGLASFLHPFRPVKSNN